MAIWDDLRILAQIDWVCGTRCQIRRVMLYKYMWVKERKQRGRRKKTFKKILADSLQSGSTDITGGETPCIFLE